MMLCVPAARRVLLQVAVLVLALPVGSANARQPLSVAPSAVKATLPVGALPITVAVKRTLLRTSDGLAELARPVVLAVLLSTCSRMAPAEPALVESPP